MLHFIIKGILYFLDATGKSLLMYAVKIWKTRLVQFCIFMESSVVGGLFQSGRDQVTCKFTLLSG